MVEITGGDPLEGARSERAPGRGWGSMPSLTSKDVVVRRNKDQALSDSRDLAVTDSYARSAARTTVDSIIGAKISLDYMPVASILGVEDDAAQDYADMIEEKWNLAADSIDCHFDAQRKLTFHGLMRSAYRQFYEAGEYLAACEWKVSTNGQRTCMHAIDPERLSDPRGVQDMTGKRRMGVERDIFGEPVGYHIRERHVSDVVFGGLNNDNYKWRYIPKTTPWGRRLVIHYFDQTRADMTRGMSLAPSVAHALRMLKDYNMTELESAAVRATYAAVIQTNLDYDKAMEVVGAQDREVLTKNPILDLTMQHITNSAKYYKGQEFKFGNAKVAHLLPNEELKMVQGNGTGSQLQEFNKATLHMVASGLGVDYASLTKDYSDTNYSGARASLFDVWRSYEVRRDEFISQVPAVLFANWLEEMVVLRAEIPMLGSKPFYEVFDAITKCTFEGWGKPRLDPQKENAADVIDLHAGLTSELALAKERGVDYRRVLRDKARGKALMVELGLKPEDIDPNLMATKMKGDASMKKKEDAGQEGGGTGEA